MYVYIIYSDDEDFLRKCVGKVRLKAYLMTPFVTLLWINDFLSLLFFYELKLLGGMIVQAIPPPEI